MKNMGTHYPLSFLALARLATLEQTSAARGNETNFLTSGCATRDGRRVSDVLVVTTTVRVLNRIHRAATDLRPAVSLHAVLVEVVTSLENRLVHSTSSCNDAHNGAARRRDGLPRTGWETDTRLLSIVRVAHDHARGARGTCHTSTVGSLLLAHRDDCTLRHLGQWHDIADRQLRLRTTVHELACMSTLDGWDKLLGQFVAVRIMEDYFGERRTTAWVVDDLLDKALDISMALNVVDCAHLHGADPVLGLGGEDQALALSLGTNDTTHGSNKKIFYCQSESIKRSLCSEPYP